MNDFINTQINAVIMISIMIKKLSLKELKILLLLLKYFENFM